MPQILESRAVDLLWTPTPSGLQSFNTTSDGTQKRRDSAPSSVVSTLSSSWSSEQDFDHKSTEQITDLMDSLVSYLYCETQTPRLSIPLNDECRDWVNLFTHLRIRGTQQYESKEGIFECIPRSAARIRSPYLFLPEFLNPIEIKLEGIGLPEQSFSSFHTEYLRIQDNAQYPALSDLWESEGIQSMLSMIGDTSDVNSYWFLLQYYLQEESLDQNDRCKTPTLRDRQRGKNTLSETCERLRILDQGCDGLAGLQRFISQNEHKDFSNDSQVFAIVKIKSSLEEPIIPTHQVAFISWSLDTQSYFTAYWENPWDSSVQKPKVQTLTASDLECVLLGTPLSVIPINCLSMSNVLELSVPEIIESNHPPGINEVFEIVHGEEFFAKDGQVDEWLAYDEGLDSPNDGILETKNKKGEQLTPNESIAQDVLQHLFDDFWSEVPPLLVKTISRMAVIRKQIKKKSASVRTGSTVGRSESTLEHDETSILDTLQIDELIETPNLLSAMTIRPIPLQKRDVTGKLLRFLPQEVFPIHDMFLNSRPASAKKLTHKPFGARPTSARHPDLVPTGTRLNSAAGFRAGQLSTKRNVTNLRLVPLSSVSLAMQTHTSNMTEGVYGMGIGHRNLSMQSWDTKSIHSLIQTNKRLPPIKPVLTNDFGTDAPKTIRHVAFDLTEDPVAEHRLSAATPRPLSAKRQPSAGIKRPGGQILQSRPHTAMDDATRMSMGQSNRFPYKVPLKDDVSINPVLGMKAYISKTYRRK